MKRVIAEAELFMDLIVPEDELRFCFDLVDTGEAVTIVLKEEPEIVEGSIDPDVRLFTTRPVFDSILRGEADIFSLTARAKMTDVRPVNLDIHRGESRPDLGGGQGDTDIPLYSRQGEGQKPRTGAGG